MKPLKHVDANMPNLISDLQTLIRQPSVSAKNEGIEECAKLVKKMLTKSGIKSEILRLKKGVAPIVYGELKSKNKNFYLDTILCKPISECTMPKDILSRHVNLKRIGVQFEKITHQKAKMLQQFIHIQTT